MKRIITVVGVVILSLCITMPVAAKGPKGGGPHKNNGNHYGWYKGGGPAKGFAYPDNYRPYVYPGYHYGYGPSYYGPPWNGYYAPNYEYYGNYRPYAPWYGY